MTDAQLANENSRLLAAVWRLAMMRRWDGDQENGWLCRECRAHAETKLDVRHAPGCILFGINRAALAALDGFEIAAGETI